MKAAQPFRKCWWERYACTKEKRPWTPQRIQAAKRALQRQADAMPLFPELRRDTSLEGRQARMDEREMSITEKQRASRCQKWREARDLLRSLPPDHRHALLARWNTSFMPGDPVNLLSLYRKMFIHRECPNCGSTMGDGKTCHSCRQELDRPCGSSHPHGHTAKNAMEQPKPLDEELTKQGKPRQRAPGAGRPVAGRDRNLPRVSPEAHAMFTEIKEALGFKNLADAIEHAAQIAHKKLSKKP